MDGIVFSTNVSCPYCEEESEQEIGPRLGVIYCRVCMKPFVAHALVHVTPRVMRIEEEEEDE